MIKKRKKRKIEDIIKMVEKYFVKFSEKRITFYKLDKRYKKSDFRSGKLIYKKKWISRNTWEKILEKLASTPEILSTYKKENIPREIMKVRLKPSKLKYSYKVKKTREKHSSLFIAHTKDQIREFQSALKKRKIPMRKSKGKPLPVIDLNRKSSMEDIIEWKNDYA